MPPPVEYWDSPRAANGELWDDSASDRSSMDLDSDHEIDEVPSRKASNTSIGHQSIVTKSSISASTVLKSVERDEDDSQRRVPAKLSIINEEKSELSISADIVPRAVDGQVDEDAVIRSGEAEMEAGAVRKLTKSNVTDSGRKESPEASTEPASPSMRECIAAAIKNIAMQEEASISPVDSPSGGNPSISHTQSSGSSFEDDLITSKHRIHLEVPPSSWSTFREPFATQNNRSEQAILDNDMVSPLGTSTSLPNTIETAIETTIETASFRLSEDKDLAVKSVAEEMHKKRVSVIAPELIYPPSNYGGRPKDKVCKEHDVVTEFLEEAESLEDFDKPYHEFILEDFSIYIPDSSTHHPLEMTGLQHLFETGHSTYLFEGFLCLDGEKRYVEGVPFQIVSADGYGKERPDHGKIWIQSTYNQKRGHEVYYLLGNPHRQYARFHEAFSWLANLRKHFVDYAVETCEAGGDVSIHNFRKDFSEWLLREQGDSPLVMKWYSAYGQSDFATAVAANIDFLVHDANSTYGLGHLKIWSEIREKTLIKEHKSKVKGVVVTPYVYECFKEMPFGKHLKKVTPCSLSEFRRKSMGEALHLTTDADVVQSAEGLDVEATVEQLAKKTMEDFMMRRIDRDSIKVGDVLAVPQDASEHSNWKDEGESNHEFWIIYVQEIVTLKSGLRAFKILWLYSPSQTSCAIMKYPYPNELFMSNHCECESEKGKWITEDEIICRVSVAWGGTHTCKEDFFVRQMFDKDEFAFTTLTDDHMKCEHYQLHQTPFQKAVSQYTPGDTVLVKGRSGKPDRLEPYEIVNFDEDSQTVTAKLLLRRSDIHTGSRVRPNELIYSDSAERVAKLNPKNLHHRCYVRFFSQKQAEENSIPHPYNRDGACDFFYICLQEVDKPDGKEYLNIDPAFPPTSLIQGYDLNDTPPKNKMRGLDLFCGGGNMGRGIEDGGAVHFTHACDWEGNALASYYANTERPELTSFYNGSVNDLLNTAMAGNPKEVKGVPLPGDIEFVSAGSPCVGFSMMNPDKQSNKAMANQALIANVAAMVEFYRPKFGILENVVSMAQKGKNRKCDSLSQLICCLVGLGYQLQVRLLDAWSFGCPQSRSRLFIVIAAPGLALPEHPQLSHSHIDLTSSRSLGEMSNGRSFGDRKFEPTAFSYVTARQGTADLPRIGDGQTYHCTKFPDHRMAVHLKEKQRYQFSLIPLRPPGMNLQKAFPMLTAEERQAFSTMDKDLQVYKPVQIEGSKAFGRIKGDHVFPTITTACAPSEKRNGVRLHWEEPRVMTIMEAKRAQGFLDTDVLTGTLSEKYRIIGNSVARQVAHAEGLAFRHAWLKTSDDNPPIDAPLVSTASQVPSAFSTVCSTPARNLSDASEDMYSQAMLDLKLRSTLNSDEDDARSSVSSEPPRLPGRRASRMVVEIPPRNSICFFDSDPVEDQAMEDAAEIPVPVSPKKVSPEPEAAPAPAVREPTTERSPTPALTIISASEVSSKAASPSPEPILEKAIPQANSAPLLIQEPLAPQLVQDALPSASQWTPINGNSKTKRRAELFETAAKRQKVAVGPQTTTAATRKSQSSQSSPFESAASNNAASTPPKKLRPNPFRTPLPDKRVSKSLGSSGKSDLGANTAKTAIMIESDEEGNSGQKEVTASSSTPGRKTVRIVKPRKSMPAKSSVTPQTKPKSRDVAASAKDHAFAEQPTNKPLTIVQKGKEPSRQSSPLAHAHPAGSRPSPRPGQQSSPRPSQRSTPQPVQRPSPRPPQQPISRPAAKAPKPFVIDLTGDSDDEAKKRIPVPRYQPVDNSAFLGVLMTGNGLPDGGIGPRVGMQGYGGVPAPGHAHWAGQGFGPGVRPSIERRSRTPQERPFGY